MFKLFRKKIAIVFTLLILAQVQLASINIQAATSVTPKLILTAAMSALPSDGRPHPAVYIQIDDGKGKPYALPQVLTVMLAASDNTALELPEKVTLPAATCFYIINATSSAVGSKQVEISATASGFVTAKVTLAVGPPAGIPTSLEVTVLPNAILPVAGEKADLLVTLVDGYGNPTPARSDLIVALFSSDPNIATIESGSVVISAGSTTVKTTLSSTGKEGSTTITASTPNLKSDTGSLIVSGPQPTKITLWALSKLPVHDTSNILFVGITDSGSNPVKLLEPRTINLYSSNTSVATIQSSITIPAGKWSAIVPLSCGLPYGVSTISAASKDLTTAIITVGGTMFTNNRTASLKLYPIAAGFPADEANQDMMLVQRLDAGGMPTMAPGSLQVDLYSASTDVVEVLASTTIIAGKSAALVKATTKLPGTAVITGGSPSYGTASATLKSYVPIPDKVMILTPPIPAGGSVEACLITMKGSTPAPVAQSTLIQITSSDTQVGSSDVDSVELVKKTYLQYLNVVGTSPGQFSLTVSASGIPSQKITLKVLDTEPSTFKLTSPKPVVNYEFPILIQMSNAGGSPSVSSTSIPINIATSNSSSIAVPEKVFISGDNSELLFYAKALSTKTTSITVSSPGFKSTTIPLTPSASLTSGLLVMSTKMPMNKPTSIKFILTVDSVPVEGVSVSWKGEGLASSTSMTDAKGVALNSFTLLHQVDTVEARIQVGSGYLSATKTITAVPDAYHLVVTSNVPIVAGGSGTYSYGQKILLETPQIAPMPHIFGLLGGKYVFVEWTGAVNTASNSVSLTIEGSNTELSANAVYASDYNMLLITVGVIVVLLVAGFFLYRKYGAQLLSKLKKPGDKGAAVPVVKPSPIRH